jgi:hypothetical protein
VVDQLARDYAHQPVLFPDHDVDSRDISGGRLNVWLAAYGIGKTAYLPLIMIGSGFQISTGGVDFQPTYAAMIDAELSRPPKAWLSAFGRREGDRIRLSGRFINQAGVPLSSAADAASVNGMIYEENFSLAHHRWVRAVVKSSLGQEIAPDASTVFSLLTPVLAGVNWALLHPLVFADYKPGGNVPAFDMLQAAEAGWLGVSDLNADGKTDLVWRNPATNELRVWLMEGTNLNSQLNLPSTPGRDWVLTGAEDFDLDGKTDLLWRNQQTGANRIWYLEGATIREEAELEPLPDANWKIAAVADFDQDGSPDLVWRNYATGANQLWYMTGISKRLATPIPGLSDPNWILAGAADFGSDGKPDLLWRHAVTGENRVWYMDGQTQIGGGNLETWEAPQWAVALVADFNGDGKNDILWHNNQTGENLLWVMDGIRKLSTIALEPMADTHWRIGNYPFSMEEPRTQFNRHAPDLSGRALRARTRQ